jgi:hypothetical protein
MTPPPSILGRLADPGVDRGRVEAAAGDWLWLRVRSLGLVPVRLRRATLARADAWV